MDLFSRARSITNARKVKGVISRLTKSKSAELVEAAIVAVKEREAPTATCKLHKGHQMKHFVESGAIADKKSIVYWDLEKIEAKTRPLLGEGLPLKSKKFGEIEYKEIIKFDEMCGEDLINNKYVPTCFAKVHYKKNGDYHIVPFKPKDLSLPIWSKLYGESETIKK